MFYYMLLMGFFDGANPGEIGGPTPATGDAKLVYYYTRMRRR